jgi:hypothetical protein
MIEMAHEVYGEHTFWNEAQLLRLKAFAELVRADEREICTNAAMAAAEEAVNFAMALEREACAKVCDEVDKESQSQWPKRLATMIRARENT